MNDDLKEYLDLFIVSVEEYLVHLNQNLLLFEKDQSNTTAVDELFRMSHSFKSESYSMGYEPVGDLCHAFEDVLVRVRDDHVKVSEDGIGYLFDSLDYLEKQIALVKKSKSVQNSKSLVTKLRGKNVFAVQDDNLSLTPLVGSVQTEGVGLPEITSVNVGVEVLDRLMNLTEELIMSRMVIEDRYRNQKYEGLDQAITRMKSIVEELEYYVMKARLVPVGYIFNRFPRIVRDLAKASGKEIELELAGQEIELDRMILNRISEPLIHLLRNAVDHGIETSAVREQLGKTKVGKIRISTKRERDQAFISVSDDGAGIDFLALRRKASERLGVKIGDQHQPQDWLFIQGLSTTQTTTKTSGRGVGLAAVKSSVEKMGGRVLVDSTLGKGTLFTLQLPLTIAIIQALLVKVSEAVFAIPTSYVLKSFELLKKDIQRVADQQVVIWENEEISLFDLGLTLGMPKERKSPRFLMVTGLARTQRSAGATQRSRAFVYVMEVTSGKTIAYAFHWTGTMARGAGTLLPVDGLILRAPAGAGAGAPPGGVPTP